MKIAVLSFGSSINKKNSIYGKWDANGPTLPIEFTRISSTRKLVPVIDEKSGVPNQVRFTLLKQTNLNKAISSYVKTEKVGAGRVCVIDFKNKKANKRSQDLKVASRAVANWAADSKIDAVIFNGLGRKFKHVIGISWSVAAAMNYVNGLPAKQKTEAIKYLNGIPATVHTPFIDTFREAIKPKAKKAVKKTK